MTTSAVAPKRAAMSSALMRSSLCSLAKASYWSEGYMSARMTVLRHVPELTNYCKIDMTAMVTGTPGIHQRNRFDITAY